MRIVYQNICVTCDNAAIILRELSQTSCTSCGTLYTHGYHDYDRHLIQIIPKSAQREKEEVFEVIETGERITLMDKGKGGWWNASNGKKYQLRHLEPIA